MECAHLTLPRIGLLVPRIVRMSVPAAPTVKEDNVEVTGVGVPVEFAPFLKPVLLMVAVNVIVPVLVKNVAMMVVMLATFATFVVLSRLVEQTFCAVEIVLLTAETPTTLSASVGMMDVLVLVENALKSQDKTSDVAMANVFADLNVI
jgi:hypothetical protein